MCGKHASLGNTYPCNTGPFTTKYFTKISFFFLILIYCLRTPFGPREWACGLWINLLVYLFLSYLSHALLDFGETCTFLSLMHMHTLQVQLFSDLSCYSNVTAEHTLHSRVKDPITQNQDCCFSYNYRITVNINVLILSWNLKKIVGLSLSEFCFKHFVHFIVCYIATEKLFPQPTLNQVNVIQN